MWRIFGTVLGTCLLALGLLQLPGTLLAQGKGGGMKGQRPGFGGMQGQRGMGGMMQGANGQGGMGCAMKGQRGMGMMTQNGTGIGSQYPNTFGAGSGIQYPNNNSTIAMQRKATQMLLTLQQTINYGQLLLNDTTLTTQQRSSITGQLQQLQLYYFYCSRCDSGGCAEG